VNIKRGVLVERNGTLLYIPKNGGDEFNVTNLNANPPGGVLAFKKQGNNYNLNFNRSNPFAFIAAKYGNRPVNLGRAKWNGRSLMFGDTNVAANNFTWKNYKLKATLNGGDVIVNLPALNPKPVRTAWGDFLKGHPAKDLGVVKWDGQKLVYKDYPVENNLLGQYYVNIPGGLLRFNVSIPANNYPVFSLATDNMNGFVKVNNNYASIVNPSIKYKNTSNTINSKPIYTVFSGDKNQKDYYIKNGRKWKKIYKLANGKWSMNAPQGQGGAPPPGGVPPPPPPPSAAVNYKNKTWEQLINARNAKGNVSNSALNAALEAAVNKQLRSVNGNSRSRKFGVYGDILIKMGSSRNYPARSKVRDAIRTELRAALRNIRDPRRAKVELERAKANVRLSRIPTRNANVRKAFEIEESNIKSRSREYNENYGSNNNRRYGRRPPPFAPPRMPPNNRYNMGPGPAPFPRNNGFRAPPSESPFRLPSNAPKMPAMPPPRINITNQQAFAPSPMAPPPTNQSLLANLPANERAAINYAGGVNKAANLVNQAGGGTNVAAAANALAQTGGNVERAIMEKGANEKAIKVVIQLGGGKNLNNIERAKNALNGLNNVAVQLKKRKRRSKPKAKGKGKARVAKAAPKSKTRVVYRTRPGDRVRTAELNKLLNIATKDEITKRMENADLLNKVYSKAELAKIYKKYVLGKNLPPLKKKRVLRSRAK
jgi:hypothetical protein